MHADTGCVHKSLSLCLFLQALYQEQLSKIYYLLDPLEQTEDDQLGKGKCAPLCKTEHLDREQHKDPVTQGKREDKLWVSESSRQVLTSNSDNTYRL